MKILLIGGTGFIGSFTAKHLQQPGHSITIFHRGKTAPPEGVAQIIGDRNLLADHRSHLAREKFDVAIDFVVSSERQARQLMETLRGITSRVVVLSSMDVYRAWGVFNGMEPGAPEPLPLDEDSALRTRPTYPPEVMQKLAQMVSWADAEYDKVPVERIVLGDAGLPATVVRLPMVYGPGDYVHRFHGALKRIDDGRRFIPFADDVAPVRTPRGYVEDVARAIALAAVSESAAGRLYNICESVFFSELEWARKIASAAAGWQGEFVILPRDKAPRYLLLPGNTAQHLVVSSERIRRELGYCEQMPEAEAFRRTIEWERAHPPQIAPPFDYQAEDAAVAQLKATA